MNRFAIPIAITAFAAFGANSHSDYKVEVREPFHHTFSGDSSLDVDNVNGSITVTGDNGNTIRVDGEKIVRAADDEEAQRGKREVVVDANEKNGVAQLYVNGPFRDNDRSSDNHGFHEHRDGRYEVTYNFTVHAPRGVSLRLYTINGELKADDTTGKFDLHNINGSIAMTNVAAAGRADTLNGSTTISFRENPKGDSYFKSFNGHVDVTLLPNLAANLRLKTFNGHAWTDFDAVALAGTPATEERQNGKFVFKSNDFRSLRVGSGGPELTFETFNGDIKIHKQAR